MKRINLNIIKEIPMDRAELHEQKKKELFTAANQVWSASGVNSDGELMKMLYDFLYGEAQYNGALSPKLRQYAVLSCLTAKRGLKQLRTQIDISLNMELTPSEIKEVIYQTAPYSGFDNALDAMDVANEVFVAHGFSLPIESRSTVTDESRYIDGYTVQKGIFGEPIDKIKENTPEYKKYIMVQYLSALCFGDFYTRTGMTLQEKELVTLMAIGAMNPVMTQVRDHIRANLMVGNSKQDLIDAVGYCVAYLGFPKTLTILSTIEEVAPQQ